MNHVTTKSMMPWMRTSVQQNLTRQTFTSRLVFSCCAVVKATECQVKLAHLCLKTSIHRPTKPLVLLVPQDLSGGLLHRRLNNQVHSSHQQLVGADSQRSIPHLNLPIRMIHENQLGAQSPHPEHQVQDRSNK